MNLYLITEFRVWITEKGTNSYNEKVLVSQWGKPPPPRRGLRPLRLWTRSSRIGSRVKKYCTPLLHNVRIDITYNLNRSSQGPIFIRLRQIGVTPSKSDPCLFQSGAGEDIIMVAVYV